ncbi:unnamed protein product [Meloidogyne enterolobii]|uniref:Uncharacterized protein n=1 Tax=Meloidogyne enterolobii TaxID=390850 RepID=A0ACB0Y0X9_MELEN
MSIKIIFLLCFLRKIFCVFCSENSLFFLQHLKKYFSLKKFFISLTHPKREEQKIYREHFFQ